MSNDTIHLMTGEHFKVPDGFAVDTTTVNIYNDVTDEIRMIDCLVIHDIVDDDMGFNKLRYYPLLHIMSWGDEIEGCP